MKICCKIFPWIGWVDFNVLVRALGPGGHYVIHLSYAARGNAVKASKLHHFDRCLRISLFFNILRYIEKMK